MLFLLPFYRRGERGLERLRKDLALDHPARAAELGSVGSGGDHTQRLHLPRVPSGSCFLWLKMRSFHTTWALKPGPLVSWGSLDNIVSVLSIPRGKSDCTGLWRCSRWGLYQCKFWREFFLHSFFACLLFEKLRWNSCNISNYFKVNNSVAFNIVTMFCIHHHYLVPEHFITPDRNPTPIRHSLPISPLPPASGSHKTTFCLYGFASSGYFI